MQTYNEFLQYLERLQETAIKPGLERMVEACAILGNPQGNFKSVQIAGTNGKGSTAAFLESIVRRSGYKTGLYTSPHLVDVRERIRINGEMISEKDIVKIADEVVSKCGRIGLSYFEFLTVVSFIYFSRQGVDLAILEAGLGGRWDATTVVRPILSLMTPISIDHSKYLGSDISSIAREKCGIIKKGVTLISAPQDSRAQKIIFEECQRLNAPLEISGVSPFFHSGTKKWNMPVSKEAESTLPLAGEHQIVNASLAIAAADFLKKNGFDLKNYGEALKKTSWPGRLQRISKNPEILVDGAHNPAGAEALTEYLKEGYPRRKIIIIFGAMNDKDLPGIIEPLRSVASRWIIYEMKNDRGAGADAIKKVIGKDAPSIDNPEDSIAESIKMGLKNPLIVVTGSLYLIGEYLKTKN